MQADHRHLDHVRRAPLHWRIDRHPLRRLPHLTVLAVEIGQVPPPVHHRYGIPALPRLFNRALHEGLHIFVQIEILVDEFLRVLRRNLQLPRQSERAQPVHDAEVHRLRHAPPLFVHRVERLTENLRRRATVNILALLERPDQRGIVRQMRQNPQLDLRIIRRQQPAVLVGDKCPPDFLAEVGADRYVLQIRIATAQPPRRGNSLVVRRMHPPGLFVNLQRQRVDVGRLQFRQLTVIDDPVRQFVLARQFLHHAHVGRGPGLGLLDNPQLQLLEQDHPQLLRRIDVERLPRQRIDFVLQLLQILVQLARQFGKMLAVDPHAGHLHIRQHLDQRQLQLLVQFQGFVFKARLQRMRQTPGDIGILRRVFGGRLDLHLVETDLLGPLARHVGIGDVLMPQHLHCQSVEAVLPLGRIQHIRRQHGIERDALKRHPLVGQHDQIVLDVMPEFFEFPILQNRFQGFNHLLLVQLLRHAQVTVRHRDVARLALRPRKRNAHHLGAGRMLAGRFQIERELFRILQLFDKGVERLLVHDRFIMRFDFFTLSFRRFA